MYIVNIINGENTIPIHDDTEKLLSGSVVQGINTIDSFAFSILPSNVGFDKIADFQSLVEVYNTSKNRYEFRGRVLCSSPSMSDNGLIKKDVTCESFFGFLCDSVQTYVAERNWTVRGLLEHILDCHNSMTEDYKHFQVGEVTVTDTNDNLYVGIQRENTWETISKKLIETLGGEIRFRVVGSVMYLDYLEEIGETKSTKIELSRNLKSITQEKDPSAYITRLIPLGAKISASDGSETEERIDISSVNDGKIYIDDANAIAAYGIHVGYQTFDDVNSPKFLLGTAKKWLANNNKVLVKYVVSALDLSLIGLEIDDFEVHNYYPLKNPLLKIDDTVRISKKTIDIRELNKSNFEIGESFKTLSNSQRETLRRINDDVKNIKSNYVTNTVLENKITQTSSLISQSEEEILLKVSADYVNYDDYYTDLLYNEGRMNEVEAELSLKVGKDDNDQVVSMLNASANIINIKSNRLSVESDKFTLSPDGSIVAKDITLKNSKGESDIEIKDGEIIINSPVQHREAGSLLAGEELLLLKFEAFDYDLTEKKTYGLFVRGYYGNEASNEGPYPWLPYATDNIVIREIT